MGSKIRQVFVLSLLCGGLASCGQVSNRLSEVKLECGEDARPDTSYVQLLDPQGQLLGPEQIQVMRVSSGGTDEAVAVTTKACVPLVAGAEETFVASSRVAEIPWGRTLRSSEVPKDRQLRLNDISSNRLRMSCPNQAVVRSSLSNPLQIPGDAEAFPFQMSLRQGDIRVSLDTSFNLSPSFALPSALDEGAFELEVSYQNLYRPQTNLQPETLRCSYTLDRSTPLLHDSFAKTFGSDIFKVSPGETIEVSLDDRNAESIRYCLEANGVSCDDSANYQVTGPLLTFQAPVSGQWCLNFQGFDKAGNATPLERRCAISYQDTLIENIRALADKALITLTRDRLLATTYLLKALQRFVQLPTAEERGALEDTMLADALTLGSQVKERNRILLPVLPRSIAAVDSRVLIYDQEGLKLYDPETLARLDFISLPNGFSMLVRGDAVFVMGSEGFARFGIEGDRLKELAKVEWPADFASRGSLEYLPETNEVLHFGSSEILTVFRSRGASYEPAQSLEIFEGLRAYSGNGTLLIQGRNELAVLERDAQGHYSFDSSRNLLERKPLGATSIPGGEGYWILTSEGLWSWGRESGTAFTLLDQPQISREASQLANTKFTDRLLDTKNGEVLFAGAQIISRLSKDVEGINIHELTLPKSANLIDLTTFAIDRGNLRFVGGGAVYSFKQREPEKEWILQQSVPSPMPSTLQRFGIANIPERNLIATVDRDLRLTSWSPATAFGSFHGENSDLGFARFFRRGDDLKIATGGYLGQARIWSLAGVSEHVFQHAANSVQVDELSWNSGASRFATAGEDGRTVVFDAEGKNLAELDDVARCGKDARLRYTAVFMPDGSLATGGARYMNIWKTSGGDQFEALPSCSELGLPGQTEFRTLPGDLRSLIWRGRTVLMAAPSFEVAKRQLSFFEADGQASAIWPRDKQPFSAVALSADGTLLAFAGTRGELEIYRLEDSGFVKRAELAPADPSLLASRLSWSPAGDELLAFYPQKRVVIYRFDGSRLEVQGQRNLTAENGSRAYLPLWIEKGLAYFDKGEFTITDRKLALRGKVNVFGENSGLSAADYDERSRVFLTQQNGEIKLLPNDLVKAHAKLCEIFGRYLSSSTDFDNHDELTAEDRQVCAGR